MCSLTTEDNFKHCIYFRVLHFSTWIIYPWSENPPCNWHAEGAKPLPRFPSKAMMPSFGKSCEYVGIFPQICGRNYLSLEPLGQTISIMKLIGFFVWKVEGEIAQCITYCTSVNLDSFMKIYISIFHSRLPLYKAKIWQEGGGPNEMRARN